MYEQETIKPYDGEGEKGKLVETMFDNIAPTYDTLNHRLSWDIDKYWRKKAVKALVPYSPKKILDIATGTGDFAILQAQMLHPEMLIGADISEGMMQVGKEKVALAHIPENLTENPFQGVVGNFTALRAFRILNGLVSVVADVHGRAIEVA